MSSITYMDLYLNNIFLREINNTLISKRVSFLLCLMGIALLILKGVKKILKCQHFKKRNDKM